jgi:outer membrane protein assembly factor BamB
LSTKLTREKFLKTMGAGAAWIALARVLGCEPKQVRSEHSPPAQKTTQDVQTFRSRPDLSPPAVEVTTQAHETAPGYLFLAPKKGPGQYGPMILDDSGQLVWFLPLQDDEEYATDFKVQRYRGEPVLTWWEGKVHGFGSGSYTIFDGSYRRITPVRAGNGYQGDLHEFLITPQDTALLTAYGPASMDLSSFGGPKDGEVREGIIQEVDIETGEVLFEWRSLEHVALEESYYGLPEDPDWAFDYFHINSIDIDHDDNLIISARKTSTVYKIDRETGEVIWRLGGKKSDFEMGPGTRFVYQHDARRQPDGTLTIFDNSGLVKVDRQSRGIVLELDEEKMTATLVREYAHPDEYYAITQANMQVLPNGNVFIGWGSNPAFSEFSGDGELLFNATLPPKNESYRAYRFPWRGQPGDKPAVVAESGPDDKVTLYASWNGATEVATWEVLAGPDSGRLRLIGSSPWEGFETAIPVRTTEPLVGVWAKDRSGRVLGIAKVVERGN